MDNNYLVSVIVPNYCHAKYLDQRIQSILNQTYQNFELIILDDCSPDDGASKAVIEKYRSNPHVSHIVYNEQNSGSTFKQWDKGISLAKGDLIWIAESDDFCEPTLLEVLVKEFQRDNNLVLASVLLQMVDSNGDKIVIKSFHPWWTTRLEGKNFARRYMTKGSILANASGIVFKKTAALQIDPIYKSFKAGGDYLFWLQIALEGNVALVNKKMNYFRQHPQKVTGNSSRQGFNMKESFTSKDFLISHLPMSNFRRQIVEEFQIYQVHTLHFVNEEIRCNLIKDFNLPDRLSLWIRLKIRTLVLLQNRLGLYL